MTSLAARLSPTSSKASPTWQPAPGHVQVPLWPGAVPDAQPVPGPETMIVQEKQLIAGKPWTAVENVSQPTLTVYSPKTANTGVAVIVFPGGGYHELAIDLEGTEACEWLASHGIPGVLLKYRVPDSGHHWDPQLKRHVQPKAETALEAAQRALGMVRLHATDCSQKSGRRGGDAFVRDRRPRVGLRRTKFPITDWPDLFEKWLKSLGLQGSVPDR